MSETPGPVGRDRFRFGIAELLAWILAAAVYFSLVRGASGFWIEGWKPKTRMLDIHRVIGFVVIAPAILVTLTLVVDAIRRARSGGDDRLGGFGWAWRVGAVAFLIAAAGFEAALLGEVRPTLARTVWNDPYWKDQLASIGLVVGAIGLLLGLLPHRAVRVPARPVRPRSIAASVALAGVAGVFGLAYWQWMSSAYLVVLALHFVSQALPRPGQMVEGLLPGHAVDPIFVDRALWRSVDARITTAGLWGALVLVVAGTVAWRVGRDLRRVGPARPWGPGSVLTRVALTAIVWGSGLALGTVGVASVHPDLAAGFASLLWPRWAGLVAATFLALAGGIAARGVSSASGPPLPTREPRPVPTWRRWARSGLVTMLRVAAVPVLGLMIGSAVDQIVGDGSPRWYAPIPMRTWLAWLGDLVTIEVPGSVYYDPDTMVESLALIAATLGLLGLAARYVLIGPEPSRESPIDRVGRDPRLIGRFVLAWLAIAGAILAAIPGFLLADLAVHHLTLKAMPG